MRSVGFQYRPYETLENCSGSDAHLMVSTASETIGQKLTDLIWASGLLDGEGCFTAANGRTPCIAVESCSKTVVEVLHSLWGGSCTIKKRRTVMDRPVFVWRIYGEEAVSVCEQVLPYLKEKKSQAALIPLIKRFPPRSAMRESIVDRLKYLKRIPS